MNGKQAAWIGVPPSPQVFDQIDTEEITVLAFLTWASAANRPVTAADLAKLPDRDGKDIGIIEAKTIVRSLKELKIVSVLGMNNDKPLGVFVGGFQPAAARRPASTGSTFTPAPRTPGPRPAGTPGPRPAGTPGGRPSTPGRAIPPSQSKAPRNEPDQWGINRDRRVEATLAATDRTPAFVLEEVWKLRDRQLVIEANAGQQDLVEAAEARLKILMDRIALYERWQKAEPQHPTLRSVITKKRKAVPEMKYQLERAKVKKAELEAESNS